MIIVRVTRSQHERVKINAELKGHKTVSSYIRSIALETGMSTEMKINEIYNAVVNNNRDQPCIEKEIKLTRFM